MKNAERIPPSRIPGFRIPIHDAPKRHGWALRYVSGAEEDDLTPGMWLSEWNVAEKEIRFGFGEDNQWLFETEEDAKKVAAFLKEQGPIMEPVYV